MNTTAFPVWCRYSRERSALTPHIWTTEKATGKKKQNSLPRPFLTFTTKHSHIIYLSIHLYVYLYLSIYTSYCIYMNVYASLFFLLFLLSPPSLSPLSLSRSLLELLVLFFSALFFDFFYTLSLRMHPRISHRTEVTNGSPFFLSPSLGTHKKRKREHSLTRSAEELSLQTSQ